MDCGLTIHFVMMETTHLIATMMAVLVATRIALSGIFSVLNVLASNNGFLFKRL